MYRLNYGDGRTHGEYATFVEVMHAWRNDREYARERSAPFYTFVQHYAGAGEWSRVRIEAMTDV